MTATLSKNDAREIDEFKVNHPIGKLLIQMKEAWKFDIGDVLIRHRMTSSDMLIDLISDVCPIPRKFKVVFIDDLGMIWIKQLSVRGGLGDKIIPMVEGWSNGKYKYAVDPEQIDSILLGYTYDPRIEYRKMRNENKEYGKRTPK